MDKLDGWAPAAAMFEDVSPGMPRVVEIASASNVKTLCLFHHDPSHGDDAVDQMVERAIAARNGTGVPTEIVAAAEGLTLSFGG